MRESGRLVAECFDLIQHTIRPGLTLKEIDDKVAALLRGEPRKVIVVPGRMVNIVA